MLKIEELVHNYINTNCDFDKEIVLTNFFHSDWEADILSIDNSGFSHEIEIKLSTKPEPIVFDNFPDYLSSIGSSHKGEKKSIKGEKIKEVKANQKGKFKLR